MKRWEFRAGCALMGWSPLEAALALETSLETILRLENGDLDDELKNAVTERAQEAFMSRRLPIDFG